MDRDGAEGLKELREHGFHTIGARPGDWRVYSLPKAVVKLQARMKF